MILGKHTKKKWMAVVYVKKRGSKEPVWKSLGLKNKKVYRKLRIIMTLQYVAKMLHKKDCSFWVKNAGRYVSKHLGPAMFLRKNGLVRKVFID